MRLVDLWLRLRAIVRPGRIERDLHEELRFHLEMQARNNRAAGMNEPQAWQAARRPFGSAADRGRLPRCPRLIDTIWQDVRYPRPRPNPRPRPERRPRWHST